MPKVKRRPGRRRAVKCAWPKCPEYFVPTRADQRYHKPRCRNAHWRELHPRVMIVSATSADGGVVKAKSGRTAAVILHEKVRTRR